MKIAVLFDGAGLARLGLEQAGHTCTGFELDPFKHHLSRHVGSGSSILLDATKADLSGFDAVWASPPCQWHSRAKTNGDPDPPYASKSLLEWALKLPHRVLWVENVMSPYHILNQWGRAWNAAQFEKKSRQSRPRVIGGRYKEPFVHHPYKRIFSGICPAILATEHKGGKNDPRRASRFYGRALTLQEVAYHQGFEIPPSWQWPPFNWNGTFGQWENNLYEAIGNGVPCYMSKGFGIVYK